MKEVLTEIEIGVPADVVWKVLTHFDRFSEWNPFLRNVEGELKVGSKLNVQVQLMTGKQMVFKPRLTQIEEGSSLRWTGPGIAGLFDSEHSFEIESIEETRVRFVNRECYSGILVPLLWKRIEIEGQQSFTNMNEALKKRAENLKERY